MNNGHLAGPLVIIGGAEDRKGECGILRALIRLAGGAKARLVVLTVASDDPAVVGGQYLEVFQRLGVRHTKVLDVRTRERANESDLVDEIEKATAVFFTGGNQVRITNLLGGTPADKALHRRHEE